LCGRIFLTANRYPLRLKMRQASCRLGQAEGCGITDTRNAAGHA
jgi:hypothetical protein